eukprot:TRINITY_DN41035_c0_g1_i1.p1 TRINITY_DN41035_c0_g1~~TRINITY_DN41035_c0_g1_i1.p1  ORF type:complete len:148 (+),score=14.59 TRINITY_DN41035_c0_g1_i1:381-824(+)
MLSFYVIMREHLVWVQHRNVITCHYPFKDQEWWNSYMELCDATSSPIHPQAKDWALAFWWALWKSRNDFIFKGIKLKPLSTINCARRMTVESMAKPKKINQGPLSPNQEVSLRSPRGMAQVFSDASVDGKTRFGFAIWVDGAWVYAG